MGYDHNILGVGNPNHPANKEEPKEAEFNSSDLHKAFTNFLETSEDDIILSVFDYHNATVEKSIKKLTDLVLILRDIQNDYAANIICREIEQLKTLLK